jgi:hypothetical protein
MLEQVAREFVSPVAEDSNVCPICHSSDRIEKASSVVRRGTGMIVLPNLPGGQPFLSGLAQALSPPSPPRPATYQDAVVGTVGSWLIGLLLLLFIGGLRGVGLLGIPDMPADVAMAVTVAWFGFLIPLVLFVEAAREERQAEKQRPHFETARARWENVYYCSRDDVVFLLHDEHTERPERMRDMLFASPFHS